MFVEHLDRKSIERRERALCPTVALLELFEGPQNVAHAGTSLFARALPELYWIRCRVHWLRRILSGWS